MANQNALEIPPNPPVQQLARLAQKMAYGISGHGSAFTTPTTYRLERGFPKQRRGIAVSVIPKFKGLPIYSHTAPANSPANPENRLGVPTSFQNTKTTSNAQTYTWPVAPK